ncbi:MAG: hypothetical protein LAP39_19615 [Acidobacteriia bacterium]|nr:hypothetical protein [Terriglobia bacterium]
MFVAIALAPVRHSGPVRTWALEFGVGLLAIALIRPSLLSIANRWWMRFGVLLNRVTNPVLMAVLFYLVITPIGVIVRLLDNNLLPVDFDAERQSYWIERKPPGPAPETMTQQF